MESKGSGKCKANFTMNEIQVLVEEVEANKSVLFSSSKDISSSKLQRTKWEEIALKVNTEFSWTQTKWGRSKDEMVEVPVVSQIEGKQNEALCDEDGRRWTSIGRRRIG